MFLVPFSSSLPPFSNPLFVFLSFYINPIFIFFSFSVNAPYVSCAFFLLVTTLFKSVLSFPILLQTSIYTFIPLLISAPLLLSISYLPAKSLLNLIRCFFLFPITHIHLRFHLFIHLRSSLTKHLIICLSSLPPRSCFPLLLSPPVFILCGLSSCPLPLSPP